jgi:hypothetical protein
MASSGMAASISAILQVCVVVRRFDASERRKTARRSAYSVGFPDPPATDWSAA